MDPSAHCMVSSNDVRSNRECYEAAKINYKVYFFFILYDKEYLYQFWSFATYVHFGVRQAVVDTSFFTIII
jgi:hypothetical protein